VKKKAKCRTNKKEKISNSEATVAIVISLLVLLGSIIGEPRHRHTWIEA
jgi:hypothetical protein